MSRRAILIVEDDDDIRETLAEVLRDEGHEVLVAADGEGALPILEADGGRIDLIVLDLMMPRMNGFELREVQLAHPAWADIPVIVLTAGDTTSDQLRRLTVAATVRKPVKIETLLGVVGSIGRRTSPIPA
jgi:DNA-binding response OmpR family regulator